MPGRLPRPLPVGECGALRAVHAARVAVRNGAAGAAAVAAAVAPVVVMVVALLLSSRCGVLGALLRTECYDG